MARSALYTRLVFLALAMTALLLMGQGCGPAPGAPGGGGIDTDGDGFTDAAERMNMPPTDPADASDNPNNVRDSDGDGFSDFQELMGMPATSPFNAADNPNNVLNQDGDACSDFEETDFLLCDANPDTGNTDVVIPPPPPPSQTVTVSGTIEVGASLIVDGDTKDPNNPGAPNDGTGPGESQSIPNPSTVGGFLGDLEPGTDVRDVYRVQMAAGQTVTLFLADPTVNDFDLFLMDEAGVPLDSSEGIGKAELVTAPANGTFLIEVFGFSVENDADAGGLYSLLVGESSGQGSGLAAHRLSSLHEFVEGEVLVKRSAVSGQRSAFDAQFSSLHSQWSLTVLGGGETSGGFLRCGVQGPGFGVQGRGPKALGPDLTARRSATIAAIKALRRRPDIAYAHPNYIRRASATPNDEFFPFQWHYPLISLPDAWDITTGSPSVIVAVIDTGVALGHPDLAGQLVDGFDFILNPSTALDGDGIDANADDPGDSDSASIPSSFHGTHVAGTVAAKTDNSLGVAGVAWDARIMPLRVLGLGGAGTDFDIAQAIRFAAGLSNDSGTVPNAPADIINMSLGGPGFAQVLQDAITAARGAGLIVIAAAGNENGNADNSSPGGMDGVVNVAAVDFSLERAPYSNFGSTVAVAGPGGNVGADDNGDGIPDGVASTVGLDSGGFDFVLYEGTSMATPHVAGVAALMKSVNPALTPEDFDQLLAGTHPGTGISIVEDLGSPGKDDFFGFGLINALNAVQAAAQIVGVAPSEIPVLRVTPSDVFLGSDLVSADVEVSNPGGGELMVTSTTPSEPWLSIAPPAGGVGTYRISVDRTGLADGVYSGVVAFASNGGNRSVTVRMTVGEPDATGGDVGTVYVLLVDPVSFETAAQAVTSASEGYAFSVLGVDAGSYLLYAGTDMNDNLFIDDEGEALGGFPITSQLQVLDATTSVTGLTFRVNYQVNLQTPTTLDSGPTGSGSVPVLRRATD